MISYGQTRDGRRHDARQPVHAPKGRAAKAPISSSMVTGGYERKGRAVIVNGLMYGSIADAAAVNGVSASHLSEALARGDAGYAGMSVRYAEEDR